MAGNRKRDPTIDSSLYLITDDGHEFELIQIPIHCSIYTLGAVGPYGIQTSRKGGIDKFQCKTPPGSTLRNTTTVNNFPSILHDFSVRRYKSGGIRHYFFLMARPLNRHWVAFTSKTYVPGRSFLSTSKKKGFKGSYEWIV